MGKINTKKSADPNSNRSKRRKKRGYTASRPMRRAERRQSSAMKGYNESVRNSSDSGKSQTKPGSINHHC